MRSLWEFSQTPLGTGIFILVTVAWLTLVVVWPELKGWWVSSVEKLVRGEFESLNLAEKLALRMYQQNRRATSEQVRQYLESLGFYGPQVDMFAELARKTRFMDRDFIGPNGIKPEFQPLVTKLLKKLEV